jgi:hypothetical protein
MPERTTVDRTHSLLVGHASACLLDLQQSGEVPHGDATVQEGHGWGLVLIAVPRSPDAPPLELSECERDCLALLAEVRKPLSAYRVRKEMEQRGRIHGLSTTKRALARLKGLRLLGNRRRAPHGRLAALHRRPC